MLHDSPVYQEFLREMATIKRKAGGDRRKEFIRLLLVALEREKMVTVSYRESLMLSRLESMPLAPEVRTLIRHALIWIWKDEDMHTVYTRGALLKSGGWLQKIRTFNSQAAGAIGGWAASVVHHVPLRRAPFSWFWARVFTGVGKLTGKVPKAVKQHVRYGPFRDFCAFNIDAERTAQICWERILDLAREMPEFTPESLHDLARVAYDEDRHAQIFQILYDALDDEDRLVPGESADTLRTKIGAISDYFLPRQFRQLDPEVAPLGHGGQVWVQEDRENKGDLALFEQALKQSDLAERLAQHCARSGKSPAELRIAIKPSFILGTQNIDLSPVTAPHILEALAAWLHALGYQNIAVMESNNIYDQFFQNRTMENVAQYFGYDSPHYRLINISDNLVEHQYVRGMGAYQVAQAWKEADFRMSFGKLKSHPTELVMLSLANLEWMGSRLEDFIFLDRQADRRTANMMLLDEFPPHYAILEGYENCPDGLVGIMGCKSPKHPRRYYLGRDALAVDMVAARHLGITELPSSGLLNTANHWFGGWADEITVVGTDAPVSGWRSPTYNRLWALLSLISFPMYMLFSRRGSLFVAEMDEDAFPLKNRPGFTTRFLRNFNRRVIGLHFGRKLRAKKLAQIKNKT